MLLTTHHSDKGMRQARNLLPLADGSNATRPGARQVLTAPVAAAVPWGNKAVLDYQGRLVVWDGAATHDVGPAGKILCGTPYQALTANGQREDRLYVADAVNPLFYLRKSGDTYERVTVANAVLDASGAPYPLPIPTALATWRNRVWIADGTNRIQHCQNEAPDYWDPLWTLEFQGTVQDGVRALAATPDGLLVGLKDALWAVSGNSQYDFQREPVRAGMGAATYAALCAGAETFALLDASGVFVGGGAQPASDDLRELFRGGVAGGQVAIDVNRRFLWALIQGRPLAMHIDRTGEWGELGADRVAGFLPLQDYFGWYGQDGLWLMVDGVQDEWADGTLQDITSTLETWDVRPNEGGAGRALLNRTRLILGLHPGAPVNYAVTVDGDAVFRDTLQSTARTSRPSRYITLPRDNPQRDRFELAPRVAGHAFRHELAASGFLQVHSFTPEYRFGN